MTFRDIVTRGEYYSPRDDIINEFFLPVLNESKQYDRATGYFTSYSLIEASIGICAIVKKSGHIRIITSPKLLKDDVDAIRHGYELKNAISDVMLRDFTIPTEPEQIDRLALLSNLISSGVLEIKIAIMKNLDEYPTSVFHPKFAILYDSNNDRISFSGSNNESRNGLGGNWDQLTVTTEWLDPGLIDGRSKVFEDLWNGDDDTVDIYDPPEIIIELLNSFNAGSDILELDVKQFSKKKESVFFKKPGYIEIREYQQDAINQWFVEGSKGVYNMCTGSGKTITALCSLERLYNENDGGIVTVIVCPQKHLVDQWADVVEDFGVKPIIAHSDSPDGDWKEDFSRAVLLSRNKAFCKCIIITINSFVTGQFQSLLSKIKCKLALVVDEAHNMGSERRLSSLPDYADYRLALSATIERYRDEEGTQLLRQYFGNECIQYTLDEAIGQSLTKYEYHPIPCLMNDEEYSEFVGINTQIDSILSSDLSDSAKKREIRPLRIRGIQLASGLVSKYDALKELMGGMIEDKHILVYCGKSRWKGDNYDDEDSSKNIRLIEKAIQIIGKNGLGKTVSRFTYEESSQDRIDILREFTRGNTSTMVAISCLDEGVDIPAIKTAIITSSSYNPKEYVQRRGRVLRKYPGKDRAVIFDMVSIPRNLKNDNSNTENAGMECKFLLKEVIRINEFSRLSVSTKESDELIKEIEESYNLSIDEMMRTFEEDYDDYDE